MSDFLEMVDEFLSHAMVKGRVDELLLNPLDKRELEAQLKMAPGEVSSSFLSVKLTGDKTQPLNVVTAYQVNLNSRKTLVTQQMRYK